MLLKKKVSIKLFLYVITYGHISVVFFVQVYIMRAHHLFETAHEVIADWRTRQVSSAGAAAHVEEVVWAQHGVVLLGVARGGEDAIHRDRHLHNKAQGKDTLYTHTNGSAKR